MTTTRHAVTPVPIRRVTIDDEFWAPRRAVWRKTTIPSVFDRFEQDGALTNFDKVRDASSGAQGAAHGGRPWYDGLMYEMIRGCADFLAAERDPALETRLDGYIERIAAAAACDPNGYVNTYTQLVEPDHRWGMNGGDDNWQHDVYNAGAMVEAAVHYFLATGKTALLAVAVKLANHMCDVMGPPPKANVVPGHSIAEEAVVKLYRLFRQQPELKGQMPAPVHEERYLKLAEFWIENRGNHEGRPGKVANWREYGQDHLPVLQQPTIEGHAVRATLLCTGLVAAAMENEREDYFAAAKRLWDNMTGRRMYVTGGVGSRHEDEAFEADYSLPNDGYLETCAAIGAAFFHHNMSLAFGEAGYVDELERVLYNGILCGVSLDGATFTYENPLQASAQARRWAWHTCPCCPPMLMKVMGALPGYLYAYDASGLYVNLYAGSRASIPLPDRAVNIRQTTRYPWHGQVTLTIEPDRPGRFSLFLRIPAWCQGAQIAVNGQPIEPIEIVRGYARIDANWQAGDTVELNLPMPVQRVKAHPSVTAGAGRIALMRGPLVYCFEEADNGKPIDRLVLPAGGLAKIESVSGSLGGMIVLRGEAWTREQARWPDALYLPDDQWPDMRPVRFTAIPYYANANRAPGEMAVWVQDGTGCDDAPLTPDDKAG